MSERQLSILACACSPPKPWLSSLAQSLCGKRPPGTLLVNPLGSPLPLHHPALAAGLKFSGQPPSPWQRQELLGTEQQERKPQAT